MANVTLRRYTNLAATIQMLHDRCLTLLNPNNWDDRNDAFYMEEYKARKGAQSLLALCFARASETYHHWRVFSPGSDGVCLEIDGTMLEAALSTDPRILCKSVTYKKIDKVKGIETWQLPFAKRWPYRDEKEFRIVYVDLHDLLEFKQVPIKLNSINRITLSPWMPKPLSDAVKKTLKSIRGCSKLEIVRSTLVENERWKRAVSPKLRVS